MRLAMQKELHKRRRPVVAMVLLALVSVVTLGCSVERAAAPVVTPTVTPAPSVRATLVNEEVITPDPTQTPEPSSTPTRTTTPTPLPSATLAPPLIALDAGHGGIDLGGRCFDAEGNYLYSESSVNLDLALRVEKKLLERGYRVLMLREDDSLLNEDEEDVNGNGEVDYVDEAQLRVDRINEADADLLLSIHQNAFYGQDGLPADDVGGTVSFYCTRRPFAEDSQRLAGLIQSHLVEAFQSLGHDVHDRGAMTDDELVTPGEGGEHIILLGPVSERIVRPSQCPGVLSETLFITHAVESELARDPAALDRLATAYVQAIEAYLAGESAASAD